MLRGTERLDIAVSAVVVGHDEALFGDNLSGTTAAELDDGILQRRMVDAIYFIRGKFASRLPQIFLVHFLEKGQKPHTLICRSRNGNKGGSNNSKYFFHIFQHISTKISILL